MKLLRKSGASRMAPLLIAAIGLAAPSLYAATNVTVGLVGKSFGHGQSVSVQSTGLLDPSTNYTYTLQGTLKGSGKFTPLTGMTLADLAAALSPDDESPLTGRKSNPTGALPVASLSNKPFSGKIVALGLDFSLTIASKITSTGLVNIDIKNIVIKDLKGNPINTIKDTITFGANSNLVVTTAPEIRLHQVVQNVAENVVPNVVNVKVQRWGYVGAPTYVRFATSDVTAIAGVDYVAKKTKVEFAAGEDEKIIPITIKNNKIRDGIRAFKVTISDPPAGSVLGDTKVSEIRISNDDLK